MDSILFLYQDGKRQFSDTWHRIVVLRIQFYLLIFALTGNVYAARELVNIPRLFLQNEMGLHKELDPQPQPTGRHIIHLLANAISQIQPQVLSFAACKLQPKIVHFNYAQLPANLERDERI